MVSLALTLALAGCDPGEAPRGPYELVDAQNYGYAGSLDAPAFTTAEGVDVEVCWDALTSDIQCHATDPVADVDNVGLIRFQHYTEAEVEAKMASDSLKQADISGYLQAEPEQTCVHLVDMSFFGTEIDLAEEYLASAGTFLLNLTTGITPGVGARMLAFLQPDPASDVTRVDLPAGCGVLSFDVDLLPAELLEVGSGDSPWEVAWGALSENAMDLEFDYDRVDGLMIGFYQGRSPQDLEAIFLDLETSADALFTLDLEGGKAARLTDATDAEGVAFEGFHDLDGTWILALRCSRCYNPAPPFLTVFDVWEEAP